MTGNTAATLDTPMAKKPSKSEEPKKRNQIGFSVEDSIMELLTREAAMVGLTVGALVRMMLLQHLRDSGKIK